MRCVQPLAHVISFDYITQHRAAPAHFHQLFKSQRETSTAINTHKEETEKVTQMFKRTYAHTRLRCKLDSKATAE